MNKLEIFFENTKKALPHINVRKFCETNKKVGTAIDFGCGAGRDTIFLIQNGWNVISIDRENTKSIIEEQLNKEEKEHFRFIQTDFENSELEKNNLFVANFSIPFCKPEYFKKLWNNIVDSIEENRLFYREFLWI